MSLISSNSAERIIAHCSERPSNLLKKGSARSVLEPICCCPNMPASARRRRCGNAQKGSRSEGGMIFSPIIKELRLLLRSRLDSYHASPLLRRKALPETKSPQAPAEGVLWSFGRRANRLDDSVIGGRLIVAPTGSSSLLVVGVT